MSMIARQIFVLLSTLHDLTCLDFSCFIQYKPIDLFTKHTMVVRGVQSRRFPVAGLRTLGIGGHKLEHFTLADLWVMLRLLKLEKLLHNNVWLACTGHGAARDLRIGHKLRNAAYGSSSSTDGTPDYCIACVDIVSRHALMKAMLYTCSERDSLGVTTTTEGYALETLR